MTECFNIGWHNRELALKIKIKHSGTVNKTRENYLALQTEFTAEGLALLQPLAFARQIKKNLFGAVLVDVPLQGTNHGFLIFSGAEFPRENERLGSCEVWQRVVLKKIFVLPDENNFFLRSKEPELLREKGTRGHHIVSENQESCADRKPGNYGTESIVVAIPIQGADN